MPLTDQANYVLRGGDPGAERLRLLAAVKWPTTKSLLERIGLRPGMRCLDVGCGIGAVTLEMASKVHPGGKATGVDFNERYLTLARAEAQRRDLNAEFHAGTAAEVSESEAFDLVFARFLLTHLPEPESALRGMVAATKPGGVVVVEDIEFAAHFCYPSCRAFDRYVRLYQDVVRNKGSDPDIGPRLLRMFLDAGLRNVELEVLQPAYRDGPGKQMAAMTMEHIREAVVATGLASHEEIDGIVGELGRFADDRSTVMSLPRIFQVWGVNRSADSPL